MRRKQWTPGKFLNDDELDVNDLFCLRAQNNGTGNFAYIPGVFNRELYLIQTGQLSTDLSPQNSSFSAVDESQIKPTIKNPKIWEIGQTPVGVITSSCNSIASRSDKTSKQSEYLSTWEQTATKIRYLYFRKLCENDFDKNQSLKIGKWESREKWRDLINEFNAGISIDELEKYCEY